MAESCLELDNKRYKGPSSRVGPSGLDSWWKDDVSNDLERSLLVKHSQGYIHALVVPMKLILPQLCYVIEGVPINCQQTINKTIWLHY